MLTIRLCTPADRPDIFGIINEAAQKYRGVIPADRWHDPYMPAADLDRDISAGVTFWGCVADGKLIGAIGASGGISTQDAVTAKAGLEAIEAK